jgi:hypothetical protein
MMYCIVNVNLTLTPNSKEIVMIPSWLPFALFMAAAFVPSPRGRVFVALIIAFLATVTIFGIQNNGVAIGCITTLLIIALFASAIWFQMWSTRRWFRKPVEEER